jgi:hypothetical protein
LPTIVGAAAGDGETQAALKTRPAISNTLRMRRGPQRIILELDKFELAPTRSDASITLVTPLS